MAQSVITRKEAKARDLKRYFTGKLCRNGHVAERNVLQRRCYECLQHSNNRRTVSGSTREYQKKRRIELSKQPHSVENSIVIARRIISIVRHRAKKYGLKFSLTPESLLPLPRHCPVLGHVLTYLAPVISKKKSPSRATLDRIDNKKGYVLGNVQIISWRANRIKTDATVGEMTAVLKYMKRSRK